MALSSLVLFQQTMSHCVGNASDYLPRVWPDVGVKSNPIVSKSCLKSSNSSFYIRVRLPKKLPIIWATFVRNCVTKNSKKSPNLVTLPTTSVGCINHVSKTFDIPCTRTVGKIKTNEPNETKRTIIIEAVRLLALFVLRLPLWMTSLFSSHVLEKCQPSTCLAAMARGQCDQIGCFIGLWATF